MYFRGGNRADMNNEETKQKNKNQIQSFNRFV